jgi:GDP-mannose 6-dehydrogenase
MASTIAVLGLGYVGCVSAACFARLGHNIIGIDRDEYKVRSINERRAPFYEPDLAETIQDVVQAGRLRATVSMAEVIDEIDLAFICVGTPSEKNGNLAVEQLLRVSGEIAAALKSRTKPLVIAVRSTVFPGTCEQIVEPLFGGNPLVRIVSNPEFLREGSAVRDFLEPSLLVVGSNHRDAAGRVAAVYDALPVNPCLVSLRTAEMIKYACNAFHAVKVAFANEFGALCGPLGIDAHEVMATLCQDDKLNISPAYLEPGFAFGGSCLPKDLRALAYRSSRLDLKLPLLEATLPSNQEHLRRAIDDVLELGYRRLGVIGLAFKENTDDLRESPVVALLEQLIGKGRDVRVFDPHIQLESIYGSNRNFILQQIPHIGRLLDARVEDTLAWAENIVIAQKPSAEIAEVIQHSGLPVTDLVQMHRRPTAATSNAQAPAAFPKA